MVIRVTVQLRGKTYEGVEPGEDDSTEEALTAAHDLIERRFGPLVCITAIVDRFDGLVLVFGQSVASTWPGWHFRTATCGYVGSGPIASARILELFGFGTYAEIFALISVGSDDANFEFTK